MKQPNLILGRSYTETLVLTLTQMLETAPPEERPEKMKIVAKRLHSEVLTEIMLNTGEPRELMEKEFLRILRDFWKRKYPEIPFPEDINVVNCFEKMVEQLFKERRKLFSANELVVYGRERIHEAIEVQVAELLFNACLSFFKLIRAIAVRAQ